jgi:hypothetical protein
MLGEMGFAETGLVPFLANGGKLCRLQYHLFFTSIVERFGKLFVLIVWEGEWNEVQNCHNYKA